MDDSIICSEVWGKQGFNVTVVDAAKYKGYIGEALYSLDKKKFTEPFLVLYGDTVSNINFQEILSEYQYVLVKLQFFFLRIRYSILFIN